MTSEPSSKETQHEYVRFCCGCCGDVLTVPVSCGNRFCRICSKSRRSRLVKRVKFLMNRVKLKPKHSFKFLTLTIPNMSDPIEQFRLLQRSFRRLRQRKYWKGHVEGGCVFYEVKIGTDGTYHIHLHAIIESSYIPVRELSDLWSKVSPGSIIDIQWISDKAVISYITKYTTKSDLPLNQQIIASKLLKGSRLFQPFGTWHKIGKEYVHEPYKCQSCNISDWHYLPDGMDVFERMWEKAREAIPVPKRIVKDFQYELGLGIFQGMQAQYLPGVTYDKTYSFNSK